MDLTAATETVDGIWEDSALAALTDYIRIPAKSPHFDQEWARHGHLDAAVKLAADWCARHAVPGMNLEVVRLQGRTPVLFVEIEGKGNGNVLVYVTSTSSPR